MSLLKKSLKEIHKRLAEGDCSARELVDLSLNGLMKWKTAWAPLSRWTGKGRAPGRRSWTNSWRRGRAGTSGRHSGRHQG